MSEQTPDLQWVERLARTLAQNNIHKLELETENVSISMRSKQAHPPALAAVAPTSTESEEVDVEESDVTLIRSKDVGLFRPGSGLEAGASVKKGQKIGRVEAVSMEHDIVSEYSGTVVELLALDGDPVEYGQPILVLSESDK